MAKTRTMMYVQDLEHLPFKNLAECLSYIEKELNPIKYAGILHDKDKYLEEDQIAWENNHDNEFPYEIGSLKSSHIHVTMQFENARSVKNIAKLLNDKPQYIQKWNGDSTNAYSYLIHATSKAQNQYQYSTDEVFANFNFSALMEQTKQRIKFTSTTKDEIIIKSYLDMLYKGETSKKEIENSLSGSQYAKAKNRIESVYQKRMEILAEKWRQDMRNNGTSIKVIWIYGASATGKTRLAKDITKKDELNIFISGSTRDPFQHYQGQETIILDELRPETFQYSDLLKMLDPFNDDVMGASRYFDKPLTAETFIITSPYSPNQFYSKIINNNKNFDWRTDSFKQLARRLELVLYLDKTSMFFAKYDDKENNFFINKSTKEPNPYLDTTNNEYRVQNEKGEKLYKELLNDIKQKTSINRS